MTTLQTRRGVSLLAVIAVAAGAAAVPGMATAAPSASAFGVVATAERLPSLVDLDTNKTGSITIHKLVKDATNGTTEGTGLEDSTVTGTPLDGAKFTVERLINVDLSTQAGWEKLVGFDGDVATAKADGIDAAVEKTTSGGGLATFSNLPLGAYVVTETETPAGYVGSKPFIITVPMTNPKDLNTWVYDVHAYPKNAKAGIEKTLVDENTPAVGSEISYTIKSDVPAVEGFDFYDVVDQYDKRVELPEAGITLKIINGKTGEVALTKGTDYKLIGATGTDTKTMFWTAEFTEAGRKKIVENRKDDTTKVQMDLAGTVKEKVESDGLFKNKAILLPNAPSNGWTPGSGEVPPPDYPNSEVVSKFGKVKITKVSAADTSAKLKGAEFEVYQCTPQSTPTKNFDSVDATLDKKLSPAGVTTYVTDANGEVTIDGLRNNDWANNAEVEEADRGWYCLVETKAPEGFELQSRPIAFQVLQTNSTADNQYTLETTVKDAPHNGGFRLPITGAAGVGVLIAAGSVLVAGAGAIAIANKRRKENA